MVAVHTGRRLNKWKHYFEIYDRHFSRFREREISVLEIGVADGGSLEIWRRYFGPKARIVGLDINPGCKAFEFARHPNLSWYPCCDRQSGRPEIS